MAKKATSASVKNLNDPSLEAKGTKEKKTVERDGKKYEEFLIVRPDFEPYTIELTIGNAPGCAILFHAFDVSDYRRKEQAKKGSQEKKTDNVESYVYRDPETGAIAMPALNMKAAICNAAKKFKDPASTRASAKDLIRGGIVVDPFLSPFLRDGKPIMEWDTIDERGVGVNQSKVIRSRPMLTNGWQLKYNITVTDSEYINTDLIYEVIARACNFSALGDYRPDFGRFVIEEFKVSKVIVPVAEAA